MPRTNLLHGWSVCVVAALLYALAVMHRTSVGVRAGELTERFDLSAWSLSLIPAATILAYACLQIPCGRFTDQVGGRRMLTIAAMLLCLGSIWLGLAETLSQVLAARVVLGMGDACTFLSVLRVAYSALPQQFYGMVAAMANVLGAVGQLAGILPLQALLDAMGWSFVFVTLGLLAAVIGALVRFSLPRHERSVGGTVRFGAEVRKRSVFLGSILHALLMPQFLVLTALWGAALFDRLPAVTHVQASEMVTLSVIAFLCGSASFSFLKIGPRLGMRVAIALGAGSMTTWALFAVQDSALGPPGGYLLAVASGLAASGVGLAFAHAHQETCSGTVALGSGIVNALSFTATGILMLLTGLVLSYAHASYTVVGWLLAGWMGLCLSILGLWQRR